MFFLTKFSSDAFKITCKSTPQCNTTFRYRFQIQTSVLMSRAIHEAIRPGYFKTYELLKNKTTSGYFGVLGITRFLDLFARVLRDGKQIRFNVVVKTSCYDIY